MTLGKAAWCAVGMMGVSLVAAVPGEWPSWRGPSAQGSVAIGRFPERWSVDSVTWKVELPGKGTSTPVVSGGRVYLTSPSSGQDAILAFDLQGRKLWETPVGPLADPRHRTLASSCNASPATDGQAVYAQFKSGHFAAVSFHRDKDTSQAYQKKLNDFDTGQGELSPIAPPKKVQ